MVGRVLLACMTCMALGACRSLDRFPAESLEAAFEREKPNLTKVDLDTNEESCRGAGATAFTRGDEVVMIEYVVGCSTRWIIRDFYYEQQQLRLVVQRTWWLLDDEAYELEKPRLESETRFYVDNGRLTRTEGDAPPLETRTEDLLLQSNSLLPLAAASATSESMLRSRLEPYSGHELDDHP